MEEMHAVEGSCNKHCEEFRYEIEVHGLGHSRVESVIKEVDIALIEYVEACPLKEVLNCLISENKSN